MPTAVELRRAFLRSFLRELMVVWPVLSGLVLAQLALGIVVGFVEDWRISDSTYFTFVTGLTIGYGDMVPRRILGRMLALLIGFIGILLTGLIAAVGVRALQQATQDAAHYQGGEEVKGPRP